MLMNVSFASVPIGFLFTEITGKGRTLATWFPPSGEETKHLFTDFTIFVRLGNL
jgi:hypothetical protein